MKRRALNQLDPDSNVEAKYEDGEELDEVDDEEKIQARPKAKARKKVTSNAGTATAGSAPITGTGSLFASVLASSSSAQTTNTTFTNGEGKTTEMTVVAPAPDAQISQTNGGSSSSSEEKREEPKTESEDNTNKKEEEEEKKKKEGGETLAKNETGSNGASETSASTTTGASSSPAKTQTISFGWQKEAADPKSTSKSFSSAFASIPSTSGDQSKPGFGSFGAASSFGSTGSFGSGSFGTGSFGSGGFGTGSFGTGSFGSGGFGSLGSFGSSGTSSSSSSASSLSTPTPAALPAVPAPTPTSFGAAPSFWASTIETKSFQWGKKAEDGTDPASTSLSSNTELVSSSGLFPTTSSVSSTGSSAPQEPVSNGEEEEERVLSLKKIKIYEVVKKVEDEKEKKVTVERGEASLRLNRLKSDPSKSRIVARDANGTFRLILNMKIFKTIGIVKRSETVIALVGFKIDEGQDTPVPATFLLKMSESDAEKTYKALLDLRQSSEDVSPSGSSDTL